ncbi:MAG TPA: hypothetical protein VIV64_03380 [Gammaproteobacteria bacterium]|jgi:uncharacterized membrane protein (DUF106 family)
MSLINTPLRALFDVLLSPFRDLSPWVTLLPISLATAVVLLLIFKRTSNQDAINAVKDKITSGLFEIRLFNDDLRTMFRSQGGILRNSLTYMRLSLIPMLWTLPPLVLVIAQLQFYYGYDGFAPGESTRLHVVLKPEAVTEAKPDIRIDAPGGIGIVEPAVWVPSLREMVWRLEVGERGAYTLDVSLAGSSESKLVDATEAVVSRSPIRTRGFLDELLYPAEPALPADSPFESITIEYEDAEIDLFGFGMHWLIWFFVISIAFAFALRKPFGVTI